MKNNGLSGNTYSGKSTYNKKRKLGNTSKFSKDKKQDMEIKKIKKQLKVIAPPVKSTYGEAVYNPENAWTSVAMNFPAKGTDYDERLGEEIELKSLNIRYTLSVSESDNFDTMRCVLVQYMDGNEVTQFPLDHERNLWLEPVTDYPVLSPFNTQSASTYRVLFDKVYNLNDNGQAQVTENLVFFPKDFAVTHFKFDTASGLGLPGLDRGLIILWVCSDSSATPNPKIECTFKMNFTDS